jgi:hypothetical protein
MFLFFEISTASIPNKSVQPGESIGITQRLIQLTCLLVDEYNNVLEFEDLIISPSGFVIPYDSSSIHGITQEIAIKSYTKVDSAIHNFRNLLGKAKYIISENIEFNLEIIEFEDKEERLKHLLKELVKISISKTAADYCGIPYSKHATEKNPNGYKIPSIQEIYNKLFGEELELNDSINLTIALNNCFWALLKRKIFALEYQSKSTKHERLNFISLIPFRQKYLWGFSNAKKDIIIDCVYDYVEIFESGVSRVKKFDKWGCINRSGQEIIKIQYDFIGKFWKGLACFKKDGKWGFLNNLGMEVIPSIYSEALDFSGDYVAAVKKGEKWGFINVLGQETLPFIYDEINEFLCGGIKHMSTDANGEIDSDPEYWSENAMLVSAVRISEAWSIIDQYGKIIVGGLSLPNKNECNNYGPFINTNNFYIKNDGGVISTYCLYKYGISDKIMLRNVSFEENGKFGFKTENGVIFIPSIYDKVGFFKDGLAKVERNNFEFYINIIGQEFFDEDKYDVCNKIIYAIRNKIMLSFSYCEVFYEGEAGYSDDSAGVINVLPLSFSEIHNYSSYNYFIGYDITNKVTKSYEIEFINNLILIYENPNFKLNPIINNATIDDMPF